MTEPIAAATGFALAFLMALGVWAASVPLRDASIVDIAWAWLVAIPAIMFGALVPWGVRAPAVLAIVVLWALRLSLHIALRHEGEDRRYQAIRERNEPGFEWKSLYLVFLLQAALACVVVLPVIGSVPARTPWQPLDTAGLALAVFGLVFEAVADTQLARFKATRRAPGQVMESGLWRYSRHPNYFGEFCLWWGLWIVACGAGAWWSVASPLLMSVLLLKVSGVTLLEKDLDSRPAYREYQRRTNAFFPGRPRT